MPADWPVRAYLLFGLLVHKLVWEVLKKGQPQGSRKPLVTFLKVSFLVAIALQTLLPPILPMGVNLPWAGIAIYTAGLATAISARLTLGDNWSDIERGLIRSEHRLVESGVYRWIRHPIYAGDLALILGLELALDSWGWLVIVPLTIAVARQAAGEEAKLAAALHGYREYCARSWRFLPFVY